jgi:hypothetical protein
VVVGARRKAAWQLHFLNVAAKRPLIGRRFARPAFFSAGPIVAGLGTGRTRLASADIMCITIID